MHNNTVRNVKNYRTLFREKQPLVYPFFVRSGWQYWHTDLRELPLSMTESGSFDPLKAAVLAYEKWHFRWPKVPLFMKSSCVFGLEKCRFGASEAALFFVRHWQSDGCRKARVVALFRSKPVRDAKFFKESVKVYPPAHLPFLKKCENKNNYATRSRKTIHPPRSARIQSRNDSMAITALSSQSIPVDEVP